MKIILSGGLLIFAALYVQAEDFVEKTPVYGVIKPGKITTLLAVNHGMVASVGFQVGDGIKRGQVALRVIERETTRPYRTTISGRVAKAHVTTGAAVTPGMPLLTILNPEKKIIEVSFSPEEAAKMKPGALVYKRGSKIEFGKILKISPLVDPDSGGVVSFIKPNKKVKKLIGDILPLSIALRTIKGCKIVPINDVNKFSGDYKVAATSGKDACLLSKITKQ